MLALPIPDERSPVRYQDLKWRGCNLGRLVEVLTKGMLGRGNGAHLDPDLRRGMLKREPGWRPLLGQCAAAQGHLRRQGIGVGDLFLFWGLFRPVDRNLRWVGRPVHAIWGWMQIGEVVGVDEIARGPEWGWAARHPHLAFRPDPTNTLYLAADRMALPGCGASPAAGVFESIDEARTLTAPGAMSPTTWSLPGWFMPGKRRALSFHRDSSRWSAAGQRVLLRAAARGQEFVLDVDDYPEAAAWAGRLIADS